MERKDWNRIGLTALILLAPGGFILGATLAARRIRQAQAEPVDGDDMPPEGDSESPND